MPFLQTVFLVLAAASVAVADIFLRKTYALGGMAKAFLSPWMLVAVVLYLLQIALFTYLFVSGAKLSYVGVVQIVFYSLIILLGSVLIFKESISTLQLIGIGLALAGAVLLNL